MKRICIGVVLIAALAIHGGPSRGPTVVITQARPQGPPSRGVPQACAPASDDQRCRRPKVADRIGTIAAFNATDGTLTIKLDGGKTVEGTVNDGTEIKCVPAPTGPTPEPTVARSSHNGDDQGDDEATTRATTTATTTMASTAPPVLPRLR